VTKNMLLIIDLVTNVVLLVTKSTLHSTHKEKNGRP